MLNNNNNNNLKISEILQKMYEEELENEQKELILCDECGEEMYEAYHNDGCCNYCEECFEELFRECDRCESLEKNEDMCLVYDDNGDERLICDYCYNYSNEVIYCEYHQRDEMVEDSYYVQNIGNICQEGLELGEYGFCEDCQELFHIDDIYCDDDGYPYCQECYENNGHDLIGGYHSSDFEFMVVSNEEHKGYGVELEFEFDGYVLDNARYIKDNYGDEVHLEEDGSLCEGFECISNPMSFQYFKENFVNSIDNICNYIKDDYNYNSKNNGMHVHISRESDKQMYNIAKIMEYYKKELIVISKRDSRHLDKWAKFYNMNYEQDIIDAIDAENDRYHALNVQNRKSLEIRIFNGSVDPLEIKARVELVHNINMYAIENDVNFNNMPDFMDIALYKENEYLKEYFEKEGINF